MFLSFLSYHLILKNQRLLSYQKYHLYLHLYLRNLLYLNYLKNQMIQKIHLYQKYRMS